MAGLARRAQPDGNPKESITQNSMADPVNLADPLRKWSGLLPESG